MKDSTKFSKKNVVAGAALVALSGFVPQPLMQQAEAASAIINVTGSFVTGVTLTAGLPAQFGVIAATDINGSATLAGDGTVTYVKSVSAGGTPQAGTFAFTAVDTTPNVDITVSGMGAVTLAASAGGGAPVGTVTLEKVTLAGIGATAATVLNTGGTGTVTGYDITTDAATINVGGTISWTSPAPIGSFTQPITLTITY